MQKIIIPTGLVSIASMSRIPVGVLLAAAAAVAITEITELQIWAHPVSRSDGIICN
jgi:hypothetical protein